MDIAMMRTHTAGHDVTCHIIYMTLCNPMCKSCISSLFHGTQIMSWWCLFLYSVSFPSDSEVARMKNTLLNRVHQVKLCADKSKGCAHTLTSCTRVLMSLSGGRELECVPCCGIRQSNSNDLSVLLCESLNSLFLKDVSDKVCI